MSKRIKNHLFRLRRIRGYSQKTLALLIGLRSVKAISDYETGYRLPPIKTAMLMEIVWELYRELGLQAVARENSLPTRFSRHIRGRVLGED